MKRFEKLKDKCNVDVSESMHKGRIGTSYIVTTKQSAFYGYHQKWDMDCNNCREVFENKERKLK